MKRIIIVLTLVLSYSVQAQKFDLAQTPPMGWNSWNTFGLNISEDIVRGIADIIVSSGMKDAGYSYIVLDDGWMAKERDTNGNLVPDPAKFPQGIKALADYIHSQGLKIGIYNCAGTKTCGGFPGTRGYEYQDARLYASWDIDYLKYDWCNTKGINAVEAYTTMSNAIRVAGRPMVFSLCEWGENKPWEWAASVGHLWRTTGDIYSCFNCIKDWGTWKSWGVLQIADMQQGLRKYAGPGHWNDPDMMEVGNGMKANEDRSHFTLWCMLAAPLIAGNDLRSMSGATIKTLTNKEMISIDQDKAGIQGYIQSKQDSVEVWVRPLANKELAVCFFNRSSKEIPFIFDWNKNPVKDSLSGTDIDFSQGIYDWKSIWEPQVNGNTAKLFSATIPSFDVVVLRLTPKEFVTPASKGKRSTK